jgi:thioredoxin-related protein
MRHLMHWARTLAMALLASALLVSAAAAFELVMFRRAGCPWCAAWDREIGPIYPKTEIGQRIPLRHVDLDRAPGAAPLELASPIRYTPTFVLVEGNQEIARIEGYPGEEFFWARLERLATSRPANPG